MSSLAEIIKSMDESEKRRMARFVREEQIPLLAKALGADPQYVQNRIRDLTQADLFDGGLGVVIPRDTEI